MGAISYLETLISQRTKIDAVDPHSLLMLNFGATNLIKYDWLRKCSPCVVLWRRSSKHHKWKCLGKTELQSTTFNPLFNKYISLPVLYEEQELKLVIFDGAGEGDLETQM